MKTLYYKVRVIRNRINEPKREGILTARLTSSNENDDNRRAQEIALCAAVREWTEEDGVDTRDEYETEILEIAET